MWFWSSGRDAVRSYYQQDGVLSRLRVRFAEQAQPLGTANAVLAAADVIGGASFLVLNADNYYPPAALRWLVEHDGDATIAFDRDTLVRDGNIDADRVRAFAVLQVTADGRLTSIIEKPGNRIDLASDDARWVGMNCWSISPAIVDACRRVPGRCVESLNCRKPLHWRLRTAPSRAERMALPVLDLSQRADIAGRCAAPVDAHAAAVSYAEFPGSTTRSSRRTSTTPGSPGCARPISAIDPRCRWRA